MLVNGCFVFVLVCCGVLVAECFVFVLICGDVLVAGWFVFVLVCCGVLVAGVLFLSWFGVVCWSLGVLRVCGWGVLVSGSICRFPCAGHFVLVCCGVLCVFVSAPVCRLFFPLDVSTWFAVVCWSLGVLFLSWFAVVCWSLGVLFLS